MRLEFSRIVRLVLVSAAVLGAPAHAEDCSKLKEIADKQLAEVNRCRDDWDCSFIRTYCPWTDNPCDVQIGNVSRLPQAEAAMEDYLDCAKQDAKLTQELERCYRKRDASANCSLPFEPDKGFKCVKRKCVPNR